MEDFSDKMEHLKNLFVKNGYHERIYLAFVKQFTHSKFTGKSAAVAKEDRVETLFSIGLPNVIFGRKIRESFKVYGIDVRISNSSFKVKNYFSLKCRTPLPLLANAKFQISMST